jgi:uncharacterized membrane protein YeiH
VDIVAVAAVVAAGSTSPLDDVVIDVLPLQLPAWTPFLAVFVAAIGGGVMAARRGFDVVGVLTLAIAAGTGGLLLRDTLLQNGTSVVLSDGLYLVVATTAAVIGFLFAGLVDRLGPLLIVMDALALGFFSTVGADAALRQRLSWPAALFIGTFTAAGGLILRDLLAGDPPGFVRPSVINGLAGFYGAAAFILLVKVASISTTQAQILAILVVFGIRFYAERRSLRTRPAQDVADRVWSRWRSPAAADGAGAALPDGTGFDDGTAGSGARS